jgi:hypothetical protein
VPALPLSQLFFFFTQFAYPQAGILSFFEADVCNFNVCGFDGNHGIHDLSNFSNLMVKKPLPSPFEFQNRDPNVAFVVIGHKYQ